VGPATRTVCRFQHDHAQGRPPFGELPGRGEAGRTDADDSNVYLTGAWNIRNLHACFRPRPTPPS
jgi:hypothetical protein